jgi:RimJ/RimL family protein N-acetyltransferase
LHVNEAGLDLTPLYELRVRTPRLELRLPREEELDDIAALAEAGIHAPDTMPFAVPWTDGIGTPGFRRSVVEFHRALRDTWRPDAWALALGVYTVGSIVVGIQEMNGAKFVTSREVGSGSWLGKEFQGRGFGTEMRAGMLHLAFDGLAAQVARSSAFDTNPVSARVSEKLGYRLDGATTASPRGVPVVEHQFVLDRAAWDASRRLPATLHGVAPCLPLFGA